MSFLEERFIDLWEEHCFNVDLYREIRFAYPRRYRADFINPFSKIIIEIQGGTWSRGKMGHNSGSGIRRDAEKMQLAAFLGFQLIPLTDKDINTDVLLRIRDLINIKKPTQKTIETYISTLKKDQPILVFREDESRIEEGKLEKFDSKKNRVKVFFKKKGFLLNINHIITSVNWAEIYLEQNGSKNRPSNNI